VENDVKGWIRERLGQMRLELQDLRREKRLIDHAIQNLEAAVAAGDLFLRTQEQSDNQGGPRLTPDDPAIRFVGMNIADAAAQVLSESSQPMHVTEIWQKMKDGGLVVHSPKPVNSVVAALVRNQRRFTRTAPNTFTLADRGEPQGKESKP
jgi:hypothetical protein